MKKARAALALYGVALTACTGHLERSPYRFYVPKNYVGWVQVEFEVSGAPPLPIEDGYRVVRFPAGGILRTSSAMEDGWAKDEYFEYAGDDFKKLSDAHETGVVNAGSAGVAGSVHFWRFFVGPYSDYMKFGNPNTAKPVIGPITPGQ